MENSADRKRFEEIDARLAAEEPEGPSPKEIYEEISKAVWSFRDELVAKYQDYHGRDWRAQISHLVEQAGTGLHDDIEKEKQARRDKLKAERRAREEKK